MNRNDILEAIGYVDDSLLLESEKHIHRRSLPMVWKAVAATAAVLLMSVTAFAAAKLLSRPVKSGGTQIGTVAPFSMDESGNLIMESVTGWKVKMEVSFDADAPQTLETVYRILPSTRWKFQYDRVRNDDLLEDHENLTVWTHSERPGELRLYQYTAGYYGLEGEQVVDCLHGLPLETKLNTQIVTMAQRQLLKLTIPTVKIDNMLDQNRMYCEDGEVRLYWSDGQYLFQLDYPAWVPDAEIEEMLAGMFATKHIEIYPEHWGKIDPDRVSGLDPVFTLAEEKTGTTVANNTMTTGMAAREGDMLYLSASAGLYKYDMNTRQSAFFETEAYSLPHNVFLTESYVCYQDYLYNRFGLYYISKDGAKKGYIYEGISLNGISVVGDCLYGVDGKELKCIDLQKGTITTLADNVNCYYVDEEYIYILPFEGNYFLVSERNTLEFEKLALSFQPVTMVKDGEDLYFTVGGAPEKGRSRYQVICYKEGEETALPIYSLRMQIMDEKLLYAPDEDSSILMACDLMTGKTEVLAEGVFDFYVYEDGKILLHYLYNDGWGIMDWETREVTHIDMPAE